MRLQEAPEEVVGLCAQERFRVHLLQWIQLQRLHHLELQRVFPRVRLSGWMPTFVSHAVVGLSAGRIFRRGKMPLRFWILSALCPILPDFDVAAFALGIPYEHVLGHRGFFHSISFAFLVGLGVTAVFFRQERWFTRRWWGLAAYFSLLTATHGILDALTSGGLGIALLAPFDNTRYFFPVTPIEVSPIGFRRFFSEWGLRVAVSEILWVWAPVLSLVGIVEWLRRRSRSGLAAHGKNQKQQEQEREP